MKVVGTYIPPIKANLIPLKISSGNSIEEDFYPGIKQSSWLIFPSNIKTKNVGKEISFIT